MLCQLFYVELAKISVVQKISIIVCITQERHAEVWTVVIHIHYLNVLQVPTNGQGKEGKLKDWDEELKEEEAGVAIDVHQVLPAESKNVGGSREQRHWVSCTLQRCLQVNGHLMN